MTAAALGVGLDGSDGGADGGAGRGGGVTMASSREEDPLMISPSAETVLPGNTFTTSSFSVVTEYTVSTGKRVNTREACLKPAIVGSISILESNFLFKTDHRAPSG